MATRHRRRWPLGDVRVGMAQPQFATRLRHDHLDQGEPEPAAGSGARLVRSGEALVAVASSSSRSKGLGR